MFTNVSWGGLIQFNTYNIQRVFFLAQLRNHTCGFAVLSRSECVINNVFMSFRVYSHNYAKHGKWLE